MISTHCKLGLLVHDCELAQGGISSPAYRPGPYSSREDLLYAFDRFIVAALE